MSPPAWSVVVLGLSISSSWGNGHATTYRSLLAALARRGHRILFLERDVPWYADRRDDFAHPGIGVEFYDSLDTLAERFGPAVRGADVTIVGSYVPDGRAVAQWARRTTQGVLAFYDIDTPVTLAALRTDTCPYLSTAGLRQYDVVLSFAGGRALTRLEQLGARLARPLHCGVDPDVHRPHEADRRWDLGYLGTYAADRQPPLERLLVDVAARRPAERFVVAGPQYPASIRWPANVERIDHVEPAAHAAFFGAQRLTLNVTRRHMRQIGYAPSVRLFEAAACGAAIVTDLWPGLSSFFELGDEVLPARRGADVEAYLGWPADECRDVGARARARVLARHTADHRAEELEQWIIEASRTPAHAPRHQEPRRPAAPTAPLTARPALSPPGNVQP